MTDLNITIEEINYIITVSKNEDINIVVTQEQGPAGTNGEKGDQGLKGDKGDKGEKGESGYTPVKGVDINQTGLATNSIYYLSNTPGVIQNSAGATSVKVGRAISSSSILIIQPPL